LSVLTSIPDLIAVGLFRPPCTSNLAAATTALATDNHRFVFGNVGQPIGDLAHGDEGDAGDVAGVIFGRFAHIDQQDIIPFPHQVGGLGIDQGRSGGKIDLAAGSGGWRWLTATRSQCQQYQQEHGG
jgi:hypothetical protein